MGNQWQIRYTKDALKDKRKAYEMGLRDKIEQLLDIVAENPFAPYPPFEKLVGDLSGAYSRRINHQHRFVYSVHTAEKIVKVISLWNHYD